MNVSIIQMFEKISRLVSGPGQSQNFGNNVKKITKNLSIEEMPKLIEMLDDLKKKAESDYSTERGRVVSLAQGESLLSGRGIPEHMVDYYDNEVTVAHRASQEEIRKIDCAIRKIKEASRF